MSDSNETADSLVDKAEANNMSMDLKDIIKATLSTLQYQNDTDFDGSTY